MEERNTGNLVPPAIKQPNDESRSRDEAGQGGQGGLTTADIASATKSADETTGKNTAEASPFGFAEHAEPSERSDRSSERVEPAGTERIAAPETRVEPGAMRDSASPSSPTPPTAPDASPQGYRPGPETAATPVPGAPAAAAASAPSGSPARHPAPAGFDAPGARQAPAGQALAGQAPAEEEATPLFVAEEAQRFRDRWDEIQTGFVDNPRQAVQQADHMVAEVMKRLAEVFADQRSTLEQQWSKGDDISTEDLRVTLRRYRSFFTRLLSV